MYWNIRGNFKLIQSSEVSGWLQKNCDICFISETHMTKGQCFQVKKFNCVNHPFLEVFDKKPRGGLTCMIKYEFMQYVTKINRDIPDCIKVIFHGGHEIFGSYIPPSDSLYFSETCFAHIPNFFSKKKSKSSSIVIGGGDLNSRVGDLKQCVPLLSAKYRPNIDQNN